MVLRISPVAIARLLTTAATAPTPAKATTNSLRLVGAKRHEATIAPIPTSIAATHGQTGGRASRVMTPEIRVGCPSSSIGSDQVPVAPVLRLGGGVSLWSCQTNVRPVPTRIQPESVVYAGASPFAVAVGERLLTETPVDEKRKKGSPRRPWDYELQLRRSAWSLRARSPSTTSTWTPFSAFVMFES